MYSLKALVCSVVLEDINIFNFDGHFDFDQIVIATLPKPEEPVFWQKVVFFPAFVQKESPHLLNAGTGTDLIVLFVWKALLPVSNCSNKPLELLVDHVFQRQAPG